MVNRGITDHCLISTAGITAGYLARELPELYPFRHVARRELDGWAADLFERDRTP